MFQGSMVALVTPFTKGRVDKVALRRLLDFHLKNGTDALVPCGTTGECATMSHDEQKRVMSFVREYVGDKLPIICGAGSNNTEEAIDLAKHAKKIRAAGILSVVPYYNKPTQEGIFRHYEKIAAKANIPVVLYNVPSRTGISMTPQTVVRLNKISNVVAIKEASGCLNQVSTILSECDITVLSGEDSLTYPMMALGAKGCISVTANIVPDKMHAMCQAALDGDFETAKKIHFELFALNNAMFCETNPVPVKTSLHMMKKIRHGDVRLPLCELSRAGYSVVQKTLRKYKLI